MPIFYVASLLFAIWAIWDKTPTGYATTLYLWALSFSAAGIADGDLWRAFWVAYVATMTYVLWRAFITVWKLANATHS